MIRSKPSRFLLGLLAGATCLLAQEAAPAVDTGDNAWVLTSSALVLLMTGPGLALFYGGLVRRKNALSTMMHSFILMALAAIVWAVAGYTLAFGEGNPFVGDLRYLFLNGVSGVSGTISHMTFVVFQMMFAIITPALISGAYAERVKFSAMLLFTTLWLLIVYAPMAHMVWGADGFLSAVNSNAGFLCWDFAGGTVVHITSGVSALVFALYLGKRQGYGREPMKPHSLVLSTVGACLLWVGWFGFNAGSALGAGDLAANAFIATHLGASGGVVGWILAEVFSGRKPSMLGAISGAVAGLVGITPAAGFVTPMPAILIGLAAGFICYLIAVVVKTKLGYDDSLDAFGVHGVGGTVGAVLTGVFATRQIQDLLEGGPMGLLEGNAGQVVNQIVGVIIAWVLAIVGTLVILKIVDLVIGLRVTETEERDGLDLGLHGEESYNLET